LTVEFIFKITNRDQSRPSTPENVQAGADDCDMYVCLIY